MFESLFCIILVVAKRGVVTSLRINSRFTEFESGS